MEKLYRFFQPLVEANWFKKLTDITIFLNPIALLPQIKEVFTASSVEGISIGMWLMFMVIQTTFIFIGIKTKNASMFYSMTISLTASLTIVTVVLIRG